jgi:hypothetical protein
MRAIFSTLALASIGWCASAQNTHLKLPPSRVPAQTPLDQRERTVQLLDRFTFGPRPGEVETVMAQGPEKWFDQQLNPASIKDDVWSHRAADYPTISMTAEQALVTFPDRGMVEMVADGKKPYPTDPLLAAVYEVHLPASAGAGCTQKVS